MKEIIVKYSKTIVKAYRVAVIAYVYSSTAKTSKVRKRWHEVYSRGIDRIENITSIDRSMLTTTVKYHAELMRAGKSFLECEPFVKIYANQIRGF